MTNQIWKYTMLKKINNRLKVRRQKIYFIDDINELRDIYLNDDVRFSDITFDNVEHIKDFRSEKLITTFSEFLEDGQYGIYACMDSKVVGHAWAKVCTTQNTKVNGYINIFQNEALIHFCNVCEKHRGQNIYPAMLKILCQRLFSEAKILRVLIDTEMDNKSSLRGIRKVGFKSLGIGVYVQLLGRLIYKHDNLNSNIQITLPNK